MCNKIYKNLSRFKLITFDITDTLLKYKTNPSIEYSKVASEYGYEINESKIISSFKTSFGIMSQKYPNFGSKTATMDWSEWWSKLVYDVFKQSHPEMDKNHIIEIVDILIKKYQTADCWMRFNENDHELIKNIKLLNKTVGVISNFDERIEIILKNMNFINFDFILSSYAVGFMKPEKPIFDAALKRCDQIIKPNEALHIGNIAKLDYVGARNAGWYCILINDNSQSQDFEAHNVNSNHVFTSIDHFYNVLETEYIKW